jgi:hypothetical protein
MAYPTVDKTYGFKPINRLDGFHTPEQSGKSRLLLLTLLQS